MVTISPGPCTWSIEWPSSHTSHSAKCGGTGPPMIPISLTTRSHRHSPAEPGLSRPFWGSGRPSASLGLWVYPIQTFGMLDPVPAPGCTTPFRRCPRVSDPRRTPGRGPCIASPSARQRTAPQRTPALPPAHSWAGPGHCAGGGLRRGHPRRRPAARRCGIGGGSWTWGVCSSVPWLGSQPPTAFLAGRCAARPQGHSGARSAVPRPNPPISVAASRPECITVRHDDCEPHAVRSWGSIRHDPSSVGVRADLRPGPDDGHPEPCGRGGGCRPLDRAPYRTPRVLSPVEWRIFK